MTRASIQNRRVEVGAGTGVGWRRARERTGVEVQAAEGMGKKAHRGRLGRLDVVEALRSAAAGVARRSVAEGKHGMTTSTRF
jgi:hypothetical protein